MRDPKTVTWEELGAPQDGSGGVEGMGMGQCGWGGRNSRGGIWGLKWEVGGGRRNQGQGTKTEGFGRGFGSPGGGFGDTTVMANEKGKGLEGKRRGSGLGMVLFWADWGALGCLEGSWP